MTVARDIRRLSRTLKTARKYSLQGQVSRQAQKGRNRRANQAEVITGNLRTQGKDNPFTLDIKYNYKVEVSDAGGLYVGASGAYFDPTGLPGWSNLKNLFKEFRLVHYAINVKNILGSEVNGLLSARVDNNPGATVQASFDAELELGATEIALANMTGHMIPNFPDTPEEAQWHLIDAVTDANNFGYAKEFGQIFIRGQYLPASSAIFSFHEEARVVFRGYKN